jgi:hypothetical protein
MIVRRGVAPRFMSRKYDASHDLGTLTMTPHTIVTTPHFARQYPLRGPILRDTSAEYGRQQQYKGPGNPS